MDATEVLYTTRAMRRMRPDPVPDDVIARIIDAGIRAPSPGAVQRWRFVVLTDRVTIAALGSIWRAARDELLEAMPNLYGGNEAQARSSQHLHDHFDDVPLVVLGYGPEGTANTTVIPALWTMCLAARAEGVGSVFTTLLTRAEAAVNELVGVPHDAGVRLIAAVPMGYPTGRWGVASRQPAHEVAFADRWGNTPTWRSRTPSFD
jgi:nitroreductase